MSLTLAVGNDMSKSCSLDEIQATVDLRRSKLLSSAPIWEHLCEPDTKDTWHVRNEFIGNTTNLRVI